MSIIYRSAAHCLLISYTITTALGCSAVPANDRSDGSSVEEIGNVDQAFSEPSCLETPFDFTNLSPGGAGEFVYVSPETYSHGTCNKAVVLRLKDTYALGAPGGKAFTSLRAQYAGAGPFTEQECVESGQGIKVWTDGGTSAGGTPTWTDLGRSWANGVWREGKCFHPVTTIPIPAHAGTATWTYRVNATARQANNETTYTIVQTGNCGHLGEKACGALDCFEGTRTNGLDCKPVESIQRTCVDVKDGYVKGSATMTLSNTGEWTYQGHAHNSAVYGSNYTLAMASPVFNGIQIAQENHGVLHGIEWSDRTDDFKKSGVDSRVADNWGALKFGGDWNCRMKATANPWLVAVDAVIALGLAGIATLGMMRAARAKDCQWGPQAGDTQNDYNIVQCTE